MSIYLWIGFGILVVAGGVLAFFIAKSSPTAPATLSPYIQATLLTEAEKRFFLVLERAVPKHCYVLAQVRLANLVSVKEGADFWQHFKPLAMKCVDFVIVQRETMKPLLVVELDDRSHSLADRIRRDTFVDEVLGAVSLPILHWPVTVVYNKDELSQAIGSKLNTA